MPTEVIMPKVDMDMATGRISLWHVAEGQRVVKGAPLFEIETDKAAMEVESSDEGTIHHIIAAAGDEVAIGQPVAWIYADGEAVGPRPKSSAPASAAAPTSAPGHSPEAAGRPDGGTLPLPSSVNVGRPRATPAARRLARESGVDLAAIAGSAVLGRIVAGDVDATIARTRHSPRVPLKPEPVTWRDHGGPLSILEARSGSRTPLVLLHGFGGEGASWTPVVRDIAGGRRVLSIELPRHGKSAGIAAENFAGLVDRVLAAFDALGSGRVHLAGHSLGGAIAIELANRRPQRIASLTLIAPAGLGAEINSDALMRFARASETTEIADALAALVADRRITDGGFAEAVARQRQDPALREAQLALAGSLFSAEKQSFAVGLDIAAIDGPVRLISGRDDAIIPWQHGLALPWQTAIHLLPATGHLPHVEQPRQVAMILNEVLAAADR